MTLILGKRELIGYAIIEKTREAHAHLDLLLRRGEERATSLLLLPDLFLLNVPKERTVLLAQLGLRRPNILTDDTYEI